MKTLCRRCLLFSETDEKLYDTIKGYIDSLEEEQKVDELAYQERLSKCENCEALMNGICKYCGCFVVVRAVKKNQSCPYPCQSKW